MAHLFHVIGSDDFRIIVNQVVFRADLRLCDPFGQLGDAANLQRLHLPDPPDLLKILKTDIVQSGNAAAAKRLKNRTTHLKGADPLGAGSKQNGQKL